MILSVATFFFLLLMVWVGSGMVVSSIEKIRRKARLSSFVLSFFVLGIFTTIPEIAIGLNAVADGSPEIFVGNLLGATAVIFLFVVPILAIFGNGIKIKRQLSNFSFVTILVVSLLPAFFILDKKVTVSEGIIMVLSYIFAGYLMQENYGMFHKKKKGASYLRRFSILDLLKLAMGVALIFIASQFIVEKVLVLSSQLNVTPFFVSFVALSLGTNLPELSLVVRAIVAKKKELALGSYLGSAATNTFIFGVLSLINLGQTVTVSNFSVNFVFVLLGVMAFYIFSRSRHEISRTEGFVLLAIYFLFAFAMNIDLLR